MGTAFRLRDEKQPLPRSLVLAYPATHGEFLEPSADLLAGLATLPPEKGKIDLEEMTAMAINYAGSVERLNDPYVFSGGHDPVGLPPTFVLLSELDVLRTAGESFAADALRAGVTTLVVRERGSLHGHLNQPDLDVAHRSIARMVRWLRNPPEIRV
jgi:acetyl esterase/lipase